MIAIQIITKELLQDKWKILDYENAYENRENRNEMGVSDLPL